MNQDNRSKKSTSRYAIFVVIGILFNLIVPFIVGRQVAFSFGISILKTLPANQNLYALAGWAVTFIMLFSFMVAFSARDRHIWSTLCLVFMFVVLFFCAFCFMRWNFHNPNYIVFGENAYKANAINIGVICAAIAFLAFLVYFLIVLFLTKPNSKASKLISFRGSIITFSLLELLCFAVLIGFNLLSVFYGTPYNVV